MFRKISGISDVGDDNFSSSSSVSKTYGKNRGYNVSGTSIIYDRTLRREYGEELNNIPQMQSGTDLNIPLSPVNNRRSKIRIKTHTCNSKYKLPFNEAIALYNKGVGSFNIAENLVKKFDDTLDKYWEQKAGKNTGEKITEHDLHTAFNKAKTALEQTVKIFRRQVEQEPGKIYALPFHEERKDKLMQILLKRNFWFMCHKTINLQQYIARQAYARIIFPFPNIKIDLGNTIDKNAYKESNLKKQFYKKYECLKEEWEEYKDEENEGELEEDISKKDSENEDTKKPSRNSEFFKAQPQKENKILFDKNNVLTFLTNMEDFFNNFASTNNEEYKPKNAKEDAKKARELHTEISRDGVDYNPSYNMQKN